MKKVNIFFRVIGLDTNNYLPCSYNHQLYSCLLNLIDDSKIHEDKPYKPFNFSRLKFQFDKIENNSFRISNPNISTIVSCSDDILDSLKRNIDKNRIYRIANIEVRVISYQVVEEDFSNTNIFLFETDTPVVIKTNKDKENSYLSPDNDLYDKVLKYNLEKKSGIKLDDLSIIIDQSTIKRKSIKIKNNYVIGYLYKGILKSNNTDAIEKAVYFGLGSKNSLGFGYLNILKK